MASPTSPASSTTPSSSNTTSCSGMTFLRAMRAQINRKETKTQRNSDAFPPVGEGQRLERSHQHTHTLCPAVLTCFPGSKPFGIVPVLIGPRCPSPRHNWAIADGRTPKFPKSPNPRRKLKPTKPIDDWGRRLTSNEIWKARAHSPGRSHLGNRISVALDIAQGETTIEETKVSTTNSPS